MTALENINGADPPPPEGTTEDLPPMRQKRWGHTAVCIDEHRVLVAGGFGGGKYLSTTEIYDSQKRQWESGPELKQARVEHAVVLSNGKVYVLGGYNGNHVLNSIECLDFSSDSPEWALLDVCLSCRRSGCAAIAVRELVYVMGGINKSTLKSVEILDVSASIVRDGPPMSTARYGCAASLINQNICVVGGRDSVFNRVNTMEMLSVTTSIKKNSSSEQWHTCSARMSTARAFPAATLVGDYLLVIGGQDNGRTELSSVEVFDTERCIWWNLSDLKHPSFACAALTLEKSFVVIIGGYAAGTAHVSVKSIHVDRTLLKKEAEKESRNVDSDHDGLKDRLCSVELMAQGVYGRLLHTELNQEQLRDSLNQLRITMLKKRMAGLLKVPPCECDGGEFYSA